VPILVKIDQEMRPWECAQTDTLRYGADNYRPVARIWSFYDYGNSQTVWTVSSTKTS